MAVEPGKLYLLLALENGKFDLVAYDGPGPAPGAYVESIKIGDSEHITPVEDYVKA
jgi:hypothetical protein